MAKNDVNDTYTAMFAKSDKFQDHERFIKDNLMYEVIGGSRAYGVNNADSDYDIISIYMDRHRDLYPQEYGQILGFDEDARFTKKEIKGEGNRILDKNGMEIEGEWRSLTHFFSLGVLKSSPNLVESLFVRPQCVKYVHPSFAVIRDNAHKFISMKTFYAFKGYMNSQFTKMAGRIRTGKSDNPNRQASFEKHGYDIKMAYHILRLMDILDQMVSGERKLDLMRSKDVCKLMRAGQWGDWDDFKAYYNRKFDVIESKADACDLPAKPRKDELRTILNNSIEEWYGSRAGQQVAQREYICADDIHDQLNRIEQSLKTIN